MNVMSSARCAGKLPLLRPTRPLLARTAKTKSTESARCAAGRHPILSGPFCKPWPGHQNQEATKPGHVRHATKPGHVRHVKQRKAHATKRARQCMVCAKLGAVVLQFVAPQILGGSSRPMLFNCPFCLVQVCFETNVISISGLVVEYIVAIDVTRARFPADAFLPSHGYDQQHTTSWIQEM